MSYCIGVQDVRIHDVGTFDVIDDIIKEVELKTGGRVDLVPDISLPVLATVKIGTFGSGSHLVRFRPDAPGVPYNVAQQCIHVLRRFDTPSSGRSELVFSDAGIAKAAQLVREVADLKNLPAAVLDTLGRKMYEGILLQLRSLPIALRIDDSLWNRKPDLRPMLLESTRQQLRDSLAALSPQISRMTPSLIFNANASMNAVHALFYSRVSGDPQFNVPFTSVGVAHRAERLSQILEKIPSSAANDAALIDAWAAELWLSGWYEWRLVGEAN